MLESESIYKDYTLNKTVKINFDDFYRQSIAKSTELENNRVYVTVDITAIDSLLNMDLEQMQEQDIYNILRSNYSYILSSLMNLQECRYITLFMNNKFLQALNQVLVQCPTIDYTDICHLNKLIYDYSVLEDRVDYTLTIFMAIARTINKHTITKLVSLGLSEQIALEFAVCRFSNSDDVVCTRRLNNKMLQQSQNLLTEQMIVDVYITLYERMTSCIVGTMYDVYDQHALDCISEDAGVIYSTQGLAVLDLLESMTSEDIRKVLLVYANSYNINPMYTRTRFDLMACPDYPRLLQVGYSIRTVENIELP